MTEQATIAGDFESDGKKDLEEMTEDQKAQARETSSQEASQKADSHVKRATEFKNKQEKQEQSNNLDPEARYNQMTSELKAILAPEMAREKAALEQAQRTGFIKVFSWFGYHPKPVSDDVVLENVVRAQVRGLEDHTEQLKVVRNTRKKAYAERQQAYVASENTRNESYDLFEDGEKHLKSLEEQLTIAIRSKNEYLTKKHEPNYNGEVDALLKNNLERISEFTSKIREVKDVQKSLKKTVASGVVRFKAEDKRLTRAEYHYDIAEQELDKTKLVKDLLVEMIKDEADRKSLVDMYKTIMVGKKKREVAEGIISPGNALLEGLRNLVSPDPNLDKIFGDGTEHKAYEEESERKRADAIKEARDLRYGLLDRAA